MYDGGGRGDSEIDEVTGMSAFDKADIEV